MMFIPILQATGDPIAAAWSLLALALIGLLTTGVLFARKWLEKRISDIDTKATNAADTVEEVSKPVKKAAENATEKADEAIHKVDVLDRYIKSFNTTIESYESRSRADQTTILYLKDQVATLQTAYDGRLKRLERQADDRDELLRQFINWAHTVYEVTNAQPGGHEITKKWPPMPQERRRSHLQRAHDDTAENMGAPGQATQDLRGGAGA